MSPGLRPREQKQTTKDDLMDSCEQQTSLPATPSSRSRRLSECAEQISPKKSKTFQDFQHITTDFSIIRHGDFQHQFKREIKNRSSNYSKILNEKSIKYSSLKYKTCNSSEVSESWSNSNHIIGNLQQQFFPDV